MPDKNKPTEGEQKPTPPTPPTPPAPQPPANDPGPVPYPRFKEVNDKWRDTQKQLDTILQERQEAEEKEQREQGQFEQLLVTRDTELAAATGENLRLRVAMEKELPADLIDRLRGEDRAALETDADALLELLKPRTPGVPPTSRTGEPPATDMANMSPEDVRKNWRADFGKTAPE